MDKKFIQVKELRKMIGMYINYFPCKVDHIDIFKVEDNVSMCFFDSQKNDVSWRFAATKFDDRMTLMDKLLSEVKNIEKVANLVYDGNVLSYKVKNHEKKPLYLNPDTFRMLRVKDGYTMMGLADTIGIAYNTLQTIENRIPIDHSISHVVKYSLFFSTNIIEFFDKGLSKELTKIMLTNYHLKGYISKEIIDSIMENEFKK